MYEAMRQRAPNSPQIAGAGTAALVTALAVYALANAFGVSIVQTLSSPTVFAVLDAPKETPQPIETFKLDTQTELAMPKLVWDLPVFVQDEPPPLTAKEGPIGEARIGPGGGVSSGTMRIAPRLKTRDEPPYPAPDLREGNQGTTGLEVCVDARGRVTSASLRQSSGHTRLDEAALKWVRDARFTAGSVDGAPQAMCGHRVSYEWKIETTRR